MATNGISNMIRFSGMATGLDTDNIIKQLMNIEKTKVNKLKQQKQQKEWVRDGYRDIINSLRSLKDEYFDVLKPDKNMRSLAAFSAFSSTYSGASSSSYFTATAGATAKSGSYTISNIEIATAATTSSSTSLAAGITGSTITTPVNIGSASDNNKIMVTLNGTAKEIVLADNAAASISDIVNDLQSKIDAAFGTIPNTSDPLNPLKKISVGNSGNQLTFSTDSTNVMNITQAYNTGLSTILGTAITSAVTLNNQNNKFKVTLGATTQDIVLATGTYNTSADLQAELQSKINAAFGSSPEQVRVQNLNNVLSLKAIDTTSVSASGILAGAPIANTTIVGSGNTELRITLGTDPEKVINIDEGSYTKTGLLANIQSKLDAAYGANKVMVSLDGSNQLKFESVKTSTTLTTAAKENGGLSTLGLSSVNTANKIDLNSYLFDIKDKFSTAINVTGTADDIQFTINNSTFKFSSRTTSLSTIMAKVNNDQTANVIMEYNQLSDKITIRSKDLGTTAKVSISETSGNLLLESLKLTSSANGTDAKMTYNDGTGDQTIIRSTNSFNVNGITFDLKQNTSTSTTLSINSDTTKVVELVKGFVSKYNEVISKINTKLTEERNRSYVPLTDDQKDAMSESEVTKWEEKAKSGLLRGDSMLGSITDNMRKALYDGIYTDASDENSKLSQSLYSIGITTSSYYTDKGKLVIDEAKLKEAIANNPDKVIQLFTKDDSGISYNDAINDSAKKAQRYKESGLAQRLYDIIQDSIRTTRDDNGKKGTLLEKAGMIGDISEFTSLMYNEIKDYDSRISDLNDKLIDKENRYYKRFSALETAISKMNSQSSWLNKQAGG